MRKVIGGLFLFLFLSGFVVAGSQSEVNVTLVVSDSDVVSVVESSVSLSFWGVYGDYVVIALILLVIVLLWLKGFSRGRKSKVVRRRKRKK